ncbi:MAG: hypothetical protein K8S15_10320 [Candidatus Aegiribacteria sp.]|nr:hypothetical protein [Candidatus Aegiribacteria sp.]
MKSGVRRILLVIAGGFLLLIVLEAGIYNWRLLLSMRYKNLAELDRQLSWKRDELLVERAALLNPERLQKVGTELGLAPVPLQNFSVVRLDSDVSGGEQHVCMEQ